MLRSTNAIFGEELANSPPALAVSIMINGSKYSRQRVSNGIEAKGGY